MCYLIIYYIYRVSEMSVICRITGVTHIGLKMWVKLIERVKLKM